MKGWLEGEGGRVEGRGRDGWREREGGLKGEGGRVRKEERKV